MGWLKRFLVEQLSEKQLLVLRKWKRALLREPPDARASVHENQVNYNYGIDGPETSLGLLWPWNHEISRLPAALPSGRRWPRISVVTATYNQGAFLEETIRSVLMQGYPELEYIVVDGGSTDNTRSILERYKHQLAFHISEPDKGQSDALNKGLSRATGEILAWLNSDDQYLPDTLRAVAEAFDRAEADMVVGGTVIVRNHERCPVAFHHCVLPLEQVVGLPLADLVDFDGKWREGNYFYQPEVFWKRGIWEKTGGRVRDDLRFAMDYELWLRFAQHGARARHIPEHLAIFRVHDAQKTFRAHDAKHARGRLEGEYPEHREVSRLFAAGHGQPASAPSSARPVSPPDARDTIPESVFDRRPVQECRSPQGTFFLPVDAIQDPAARAIRAGAAIEPGVLLAAEKLVVPGTVVLEIGAGFGQLAVLLSRLTGEAGQVLAFEPDEYVFDILQRNVRANQCSNVRAFLGAVFDGSRPDVFFPKPEYARFPSYSTQRIDLAASGGKTVNALAIDGLGIQAPVSYMHVRAPGSELHALRGAVDTISRFRMPIAIELDDVSESGSAPAALAAFLRSVHYRIGSSIGGSGFLALPDDGSAAAPTEPLNAGRGPAGLAHPDISISRAPFQRSLCKLLKTRQEVEECTRFLKLNGFVSHNLRCKDWDLAHIVPEIGDGNFLDMGSSDSYVLMNLSLKRIRGELHGIDLQQPDLPVSGVRYAVGDLMKTGLPGGHFSNITCLSVLEHQVDFARFAAEASRLLVPGGRLFVTFDYWEPKVRPPIKLYGLEWQPLDAETLRRFIDACAAAGLHIVHDFDWESTEQVIRWGYYSPHPEIGYTFGVATFRKS